MGKSPKLFTEQKMSLGTMQRLLNLDKMCLYRYVGNYEKIEKMPYNIILGIAKLENMEPNELYNKMLVYSLQNSKKGDD